MGVLTAGDRLTAAREDFGARSWRRAHAALTLTDRETPLMAADLTRLAICCQMLGRMDDYFPYRERAFQAHLDAGAPLGAAREAWWIGTQHVVVGRTAAGGGWLATARRLVDSAGADCVEWGYLELSDTFALQAGGDIPAAEECARAAVARARRFGDADLAVLALHRHGLMLIDEGRCDEGLALLDEAMVALGRGSISPQISGIVYCNAISGCWSAYEIGRAQEWTAAMTRWTAAQPEPDSFAGECQVHRAEIRQLHGDWSDALDVAQTVRGMPADDPTLGEAEYVCGELARLVGDAVSAESGFRQASRLGVEPQPGLALLRLAQGSVQAARAMIRRALADSGGPARRVELLAGAVDVLLASDDPAGAAEVVAELRSRAERGSSAIVEAVARHAAARVALHADLPAAALGDLRPAVLVWRRFGMPYQLACARALIGAACRALGDEESAQLEFAAARAVFAELGAAPDVARVDALASLASHWPDSPLTAREREVLRLVASGATNRAIAGELVLSERTVDRHVSNIFAKLDVTSRAAATAYAYEHALI